MLSLNGPVQEDPEHKQQGRHDHDEVRHAPEPTDGNFGELSGVGQLQRNAARVSIVQSDNHGACAKSGNESVYAEF
jgi:hypothetical protein